MTGCNLPARYSRTSVGIVPIALRASPFFVCVLSLTSAAAPALPLAAHHRHLPHAMPGADVRVTS